MTEDDRLPSPEGPNAPETGPPGPVHTPASPGPTTRGAVDRRVVDVLLAVVLFAAALLWFSLTLDRTFHLTDEGYLLRMGQRVAQGELPHLDFVEDYGPGVFVAIGGLWRAGGGEILFVREAIAVWKALAVVLAFALTRRAGAPAFVALGVGFLSIVYWGRASLNVSAPHAALMTVPLCMASAHVLIGAMRPSPGDDPVSPLADERRRRRRIALAGAIGGLAVLFKQSLGVMNGYGLVLALVALALCRLDPAQSGSRPPVRTGPVRFAWLTVWAVLAFALLIPGLGYLGAVDYAVHFAPVHAFMIAVGVAFMQRTDPTALASLLRDRLLPLAIGAAIPLGAVVLFFLANGHLDDLWIGMFERPLRRRNYAIPTYLPPASISLFVLGAVLCLVGACLRIGRGSRRAVWMAAAGAGLVGLAIGVVPHANPNLYAPRVLVRSALPFDWVLHSVTLFAATALFGPRLVARAHAPPVPIPAGSWDHERTTLQAIVPLFFFSALLSFQIYPRGGHNVWLVQAAWMPLLGLTLYEAGRRWAGDAPLARRAAVAGLLSIVPLWLAGPVAAQSWRLHRAPHRALAVPHAEGMQVGLASIADWHLEDVEALVAHLAHEPPGPLLLLGGDAMLHVLTNRPALRPEHEYAVQNVVLDMLPLRELGALDDGGWVPALEAEPDAVVVFVRDPAGRRVLAALPSLQRHLEQGHAVTHRFGRYQVFEPVDPDRRMPKLRRMPK